MPRLGWRKEREPLRPVLTLAVLSSNSETWETTLSWSAIQPHAWVIRQSDSIDNLICQWSVEVPTIRLHIKFSTWFNLRKFTLPNSRSTTEILSLPDCPTINLRMWRREWELAIRVYQPRNERPYSFSLSSTSWRAKISLKLVHK